MLHCLHCSILDNAEMEELLLFRRCEGEEKDGHCARELVVHLHPLERQLQSLVGGALREDADDAVQRGEEELLRRLVHDGDTQTVDAQVDAELNGRNLLCVLLGAVDEDKVCLRGRPAGARELRDTEHARRPVWLHLELHQVLPLLHHHRHLLEDAVHLERGLHLPRARQRNQQDVLVVGVDVVPAKVHLAQARHHVSLARVLLLHQHVE
mmetsp:Transcript_301/g.1058  ORF Transcript_301/g.1058 Transcript_301/m.1058 type:complete len:210 (+) Transcript_301:1489-2118(+)